ncbi:hypothetical protein [Pseudonocardia sp. KRD291]|uniref:hypothetical protein n=1 Tax=Pseudonocardia sp. KRD291 TaxID=2792007 RepID=UPI001C49E2A5|nr:hypothetical protein [Pseudonocardia sp. KRD291]MBW0104063.1 hypothetical protein [Pseudonocardia sp. KRD291]
MGGRHRHAINVRADGLATVLAPLLTDTRVRSAALVDVDSGMVLDTCGGPTEPGRPDPEELAGGHAELMRIALGLLPGPDAGDSEIVVDGGNGVAHVLRTVRDPHGDRLALAVVVEGSPRVVARIRRKLRAVSASALTAGPSMSLRPAADGWSSGPSATPPERFVPRPRPVRRPVETEPEPVPARVPAMTALPSRHGPPAGPPSAGSIWLAAPVPSEVAPFGPAGDAATAGPFPAAPPPAASGDAHPAGPVPPLDGPVPRPDRRPTPPAALPPGPRRPTPADEQPGR